MKKISLVILLLFCFINYSFCQFNTILKLNGNVLKYGDSILYKSFNIMELQPTVWLNGSSVVKDGSNYVSKWNDLSGNENHAVQVAGANQPLYVADGGDEFNNYPVIRFDGSNDFFNGTLINGIESSSITIFAVVNGELKAEYYCEDGIFTINTEVAGFWFERGTGNRSLAIWNKNQFVRGLKELPHEGFQAKILSAKKIINTRTSLYINGNVIATSTNAILNQAFTNTNYVIGKSNYYYKGSFAEIIVFKKELTEAERMKVERYLNAKYNIY